MTKSEFISRLSNRLSGIPEVERKEAIDYYLNYFEDAGVENEEKVIKELGSPEKVAEQILSEYRELSTNMKSNEIRGGKSFWEEHRALAIVLIVILVICAFPVWSGLAGGLLGLICGFFGILVGIAAIGVGGVIGGIALIVAGVFQLMAMESGLFLLMTGFGLIFIAIGLLALLATIWIGWRFIPWLVKQISGLFHKKKIEKEGTQHEEVY